MFLEHSLDTGHCAKQAATHSPWAGCQSQYSLFYCQAACRGSHSFHILDNFKFFLSVRHDVVCLDAKILILRLFSFLFKNTIYADKRSTTSSWQKTWHPSHRSYLILGVCSLLSADLVTFPEVNHHRWWCFHHGWSAPRWLELDHPQKHKLLLLVLVSSPPFPSTVTLGFSFLTWKMGTQIVPAPQGRSAKVIGKAFCVHTAM